MQPDVLAALCFILLFFGGNFLYFSYRYKHGIRLLDKWARDNEFELLQRVYKGWLPITIIRPAFYIIVRDQDGNERGGWFKYGSAWDGVFGLFLDDTQVVWDD
jgi:hypothetical protein